MLNRENLRLTDWRKCFIEVVKGYKGRNARPGCPITGHRTLRPDSQQAQAQRYDWQRGGILTPYRGCTEVSIFSRTEG